LRPPSLINRGGRNRVLALCPPCPVRLAAAAPSERKGSRLRSWQVQLIQRESKACISQSGHSQCRRRRLKGSPVPR
jgi:hypothetical protein